MTNLIKAKDAREGGPRVIRPGPHDISLEPIQRALALTALREGVSALRSIDHEIEAVYERLSAIAVERLESALILRRALEAVETGRIIPLPEHSYRLSDSHGKEYQVRRRSNDEDGLDLPESWECDCHGLTPYVCGHVRLIAKMYECKLLPTGGGERTRKRRKLKARRARDYSHGNGRSERRMRQYISSQMRRAR